MNGLKCLLASAVGLVVGAGQVQAGLMTLQSTDNGWYDNAGNHSTTNTNTWTGTDGSIYRNSFYNFDVSSLSGSTITSASITFFAGNGYYQTSDSFETLEIWDVNTTPGLGSSLAVYNDLMSGVRYGQTDVATPSSLDPMPAVTVVLSSQSFNDILDDNFFSLGAHISTLAPNAYQVLWASSSWLPAAQLTVETTTANTVPEPASLAIFGAMGLAVCGMGRRRRKALLAA